jgi:hypothetical protein
MVLIGSLLLIAGTLFAKNIELPTGKVIFHETWSYPETQKDVLKLGAGPTQDKWSCCFTDNFAWVLASQASTGKNELLLPVATPPKEIWDLSYMKSLHPKSQKGGSVWLPFGSHGINRIRHNFASPYPESGALDCFLWTPKVENLRERGVTLVLDTPQGQATIALGKWFWMDTLCYKITCIRKGQAGYDDMLYHPLEKLKLTRTKGDPAQQNIWHDFIIDLGKSDPNKVIFGYRTQNTPEKKTKTQSIELIRGKDYTGIKAIVIGGLPFASYTGKNEWGDNAFFVGDVWLTANP